MRIETIPNRGSPPCILLRHSYREAGKVKKRTLANLTHWPAEVVEGLRVLLDGGCAVKDFERAFQISRSLPHGHVAAVLGTMKRLGMPEIIDPVHSRPRDLVLGLIGARVLKPDSKLATSRTLARATHSSSLAEELDIVGASDDELYESMDWLEERQVQIEQRLAQRHLTGNTLLLYDVSSSYFEGKTCPLARMGYSRDEKRGSLQIVYGLLCDIEGRPIAVEVYDGNTSDPATLRTQIEKVRQRFGLERVVFVADRGLLTEARIREDLKPLESVEWITCLRAEAVRGLVQAGTLQLSLFDKQNLCELHSDAYPGERLVGCYNPLLAAERTRKRQSLLEATERELSEVAKATERQKRALRGAAKIGLRVGRVLGRFKMAKHFIVNITDSGFTFQRNEQKIAEEQRLDGVYIIRTSVAKETLDAAGAVRTYKRLSHVERAFRICKGLDLQIRPIGHRRADRVRAHVLLCMLAYYVEWHMREALAAVLFEDHEKAAAEAQRESPVLPAQRSDAARRKARRQRTDDGVRLHSFRTMLDDLGTITKNTIQPKVAGARTFIQITQPTTFQHRALELLGVTL